jgi:tetratricopeptide (TPR) repeat protein
VALSWHAGNAEALARINEDEVDHRRKASRARRVLERQPLDGRAYRQLAEVEHAAGNRERAFALYTLAYRYSPRDRLARAWLADYAYAEGDHQLALAHVDALLRMDAELREPLFGRLVLLAEYRPFRAGLADLLRTGPAWRSQFTAWWHAQSKGIYRQAPEPTHAGFLKAVADAMSRHEHRGDPDVPFGP